MPNQNEFEFYLVYKQSGVPVICTEIGTNRMHPAITKPSPTLTSDAPFVNYHSD